MFASPLKLAVRLCVPAASPVVNEATATPPVWISGTEASTFIPSRKITEPVGTPVEGATRPTVAVNVTCWPVTAGLGDEVSVVVVAALATISVSGVDVLGRTLRSAV